MDKVETAVWRAADDARYHELAATVLRRNGTINGHAPREKRDEFKALRKRRGNGPHLPADYAAKRQAPLEEPADKDVVLPDAVEEAGGAAAAVPASYGASVETAHDAASGDIDPPEGIEPEVPDSPEPLLPLTQTEIIELEQLHQRAMGSLTPFGEELTHYRDLLARWDATEKVTALEAAEYGGYQKTLK
ncbi:unnamed protein product, partial [marine sediment metagenome]